MINRTQKAISLLLVILCFSLTTAEKVELHQEKIYEYKLGNGPFVFEIDANLVKNQAEFLMIEVESLTPRQDVFIFVSLQGKTALRQEDSDILCSRYDYDVCLIPAAMIKKFNPTSDDIKVIFTVRCNNDCSFELYSSYENYLPLPLNDEKILLVKENNQIELILEITNTQQKPISTFILTAELLNPIEIEHYFSMSIYPKDETKPLFEAENLGNGPLKGVYEIRGDKICQGQCTLLLNVQARKGSLLKFTSYGYNQVRDIEPFKIYNDQVEPSKLVVMKLDLNYFKEVEHINLNQKTINFSLVPKSGTCSLNVHPSLNQPAKLTDYQFQSQDENTQNIRIHYELHKNEQHVYWVGIQAKQSRCVFSIKVDFVDTYNQQITINHPITSIASQGQIEYYKLTLLGNHGLRVKTILHSDNPLTELFVKVCKKDDDCIISNKDIQKKTGFLEYSGSSSAQSKIVKFNHNPAECPDYKPYKEINDTFPSCTYLIAIYSAQGDTKFTVEALSSYSNYITIRENESFYDHVSQQDDNTYRFQVFDDLEEIKFITKPQYGEITMFSYFSVDGNKVNVKDNSYTADITQWNEMVFKFPKKGFYYIQVYGNTDSAFTITPVVNRPERQGQVQIFRLIQDLPHQVIHESSKIPSHFEINVHSFGDLYPEIWVKIDRNSNDYEIYMTKDKDLLISGDVKKFEWQFTSHSKTDLHLDSDAIRTIKNKKLYIKVVPIYENVSQFFIIKYHFNFAYSILEYSKPVKGHISAQSVILYKIPVSQQDNLQITKSVVNSRQSTVRLQIDFYEQFSGMVGFFEEYLNDIVSIPAQFIEQGCQTQKSDICFMYINVLSEKDCDYQIQVDKQNDDTIIMAYDGYSNLLLTPARASVPIQVNYMINKPEALVITTQQAKGLSLCASIVNSQNQQEIIDFPKLNDCQFASDNKEFYDHQYLKISKKDIEERCKFSDTRLVCGLTLSIFSNKDSDIRDKFRLSFSSGMVELHKGKPIPAHAAQQTMEYFKYVSSSEDPIKIHVIPIDSSELDVFVVFGEENRPIPFKDYGWSLQLQNYDENILEINTPLTIQNGSLQGVYIIGIYSKFSYSRFNVLVTQEILHVQEIFQNSIYNFKISPNQGLYFEYIPQYAETEFTIKLAAQYGNPKIAVKKMKVGHINDKSLPSIVTGDYAFTNKYDFESDSLTIRVLECDECIYYIQVYSFNENSKFSMSISATDSQLMLYNHVYQYKFDSYRRVQEFQYHSNEQGYILINMDYGEGDVQITMNGKTEPYRLMYFIKQQYAFGQDIQISVTCQNCSFSIQAVRFDDLATYKFGQMKYLILEPNEEHKMQFSFNPTKAEEILKLNLIVENPVSDDHSLLMYKPEVTIYYLEKRYDEPKKVPYKIHKFHENFTLQFQGKQGQYSIKIQWVIHPKLKDLNEKHLYLKVFMTQNEAVFLQPYTQYSAHVLSGTTTEIVQKKVFGGSDLRENDKGMEIIVHICSGKLSSMAASQFYRESQYTNKETDTHIAAFSQVANNIFIYDSIGIEKELFIELAAAHEETYFNLHSQPIEQGQVSLYKKVFLKDEQISFDIQEDIVNLEFDGVQILDEYIKENVKPTIKYEIFFFKKVTDISNQLCPQIDLLENETDENSKEEKNKESGLFLATFISSEFNKIETFQVNKKKIMEDRNMDDFYFTVQAQVNYDSQNAKLMFNLEKIHQVVVPIETSHNEGFNYFLYVIIFGCVVAIVFLVYLVRRKLKYGLLPETHDVQLEQVGQQEVSQMKAPNHVISPNMSIVQNDRQGQHGSVAVFSGNLMNPASSSTMDPSGRIYVKNEQNL